MNPYDVLGVKSTDNWDTIRKAYRQALLQHHPDKHINSTESMKQLHDEECKRIIMAYKMLEETHGNEDINYWKNKWAHLENLWKTNSMNDVIKDTLKATFKDTLKSVVDKYTDNVKHKIKVPITLNDIHNNVTKRVRVKDNIEDNGTVILVSCEEACRKNSSIKLQNGRQIVIQWEIETHPLFDIDGYDLSIDREITLMDIIRGATFSLDGLDGTIEWKVDSFQDIQEPIKIENKGLCGKGNLWIYLYLKIPSGKGEINENDWDAFLNLLTRWHSATPLQNE